MNLKQEYEELSKRIERVRCNPQGCAYCVMEDICTRVQHLEKWHRKEIE